MQVAKQVGTRNINICQIFETFVDFMRLEILIANAQKSGGPKAKGAALPKVCPSHRLQFQI